MNIRERYVAVEVAGNNDDDPASRFTNVPYHAIRCFDENGAEICATPGSIYWKQKNYAKDPLDSGFTFDDSFSGFNAITLDPPGGKGYLAICKGKNGYLPGTLCECEPEVRNYWMSFLDQALDDDFDMYSNRIECHSAMTDEPYAYGYNDCIKEEYYRRFGQCAEKDMDTTKIAEIRGDTFSALFAAGAKKVHARGKKVVTQINLEMLHKPIPYTRLRAYPMNVGWQWQRWLEETEPDVINLQKYIFRPLLRFSSPRIPCGVFGPLLHYSFL